MISMSELSDAWREIIPASGGKAWGAELTKIILWIFSSLMMKTRNMQMMLISEFLPTIPPSSQQISVRANFRHDGKYAGVLFFNR